jgi:membrane protein DedA with SNARE-associated domain
MDWWRFLFWNAFGGIVWATVVGLVAYWGGEKAADAIAHYGLLGALGVGAILVVGWIVLHFVTRRVEEKL